MTNGTRDQVVNQFISIFEDILCNNHKISCYNHRAILHCPKNDASYDQCHVTNVSCDQTVKWLISVLRISLIDHHGKSNAHVAEME